jgi:hypothetical protein
MEDRVYFKCNTVSYPHGCGICFEVNCDVNSKLLGCEGLWRSTMKKETREK